jgi:hypothetical protein
MMRATYHRWTYIEPVLQSGRDHRGLHALPNCWLFIALRLEELFKFW